MPFIDLTHPFTASMPPFPGDPVPTLRLVGSVENDGYCDHELKTGMHVGTHIDAPLHMIAGGKKISEYGPEKFTGNGVLIDARGHTVIDIDLLENISIHSGDILLLYTGMSSLFGEASYFEDHPEVSEAFAKRLIEMKVKMLGMDSTSPDKAPHSIHKLLLARDILLIENLTNLEQLLEIKQFEIIALPLRIEANASPARVIARAFM